MREDSRFADAKTPENTLRYFSIYQAPNSGDQVLATRPRRPGQLDPAYAAEHVLRYLHVRDEGWGAAQVLLG